jgi:hypothetical protein
MHKEFLFVKLEGSVAIQGILDEDWKIILKWILRICV